MSTPNIPSHAETPESMSRPVTNEISQDDLGKTRKE